MIEAIDHVVLLVHDLEKAAADFGALGFTVVPGGEHADGKTHNALIAFADGAYIELVAFLKPSPEHFFYRGQGFEGLVTFALLPGAIAHDIEAARTRGLDIAGPRDGGRTRPDGQRLEWQLGIPQSRDLPFLCGDVTPRDRRVPGGDATEHVNGVTGVSSITVAVQHIDRSIKHYSALLGQEPDLNVRQDEPPAHVAAFHLGDATVVLIEPVGGPGPMSDYLETHGEGPYTLALRTTRAENTGDLDIVRTHDARITLIRGLDQGSTVGPQL